MIHIENQNDIYSKRFVWIWLLSAFKAGFINSAGFLATGKFVSHVTGFGTQVGIAVGIEDFLFGAELLIIPISFIFGGIVTSAILDQNYERWETPNYHLVQGLICLLIGFVILLGESGSLLNNFNPAAATKHDLIEFFTISILCFICGLKNALVTWTTKGKIRVTHLTGLSTDIGLNFIRTIFPSQPGPVFKESKVVNLIRIATLASFSAGAFISAIAFPRVGYKCFFLVLAISVLFTIIAINDRRLQKAKYHQDQKNDGPVQNFTRTA